MRKNSLERRSRRWNNKAHEVVLDREDDSDAYTATYLRGDVVQGVIEYPHQGHWCRMGNDIDAWRKNGVVPIAATQQHPGRNDLAFR